MSAKVSCLDLGQGGLTKAVGDLSGQGQEDASGRL